MSRAPFLKAQALDAVSRPGFDVTEETRFPLRLVAADEELGLDDTARDFLNEWDADVEAERREEWEQQLAEDREADERERMHDLARGWGNRP